MTGLCQCGCGESAPIASRNYTHRGITKGQPFRFIQGHQQRGRRPLTVEQRFFIKVTAGDCPDSCWMWTGARLAAGYGRFWVAPDQWIVAHRWAYEHFIGDLPDALELDHVCRSRPCVNPWHLEPVTHAVNLARMRTNQESLNKGAHQS